MLTGYLKTKGFVVILEIQTESWLPITIDLANRKALGGLSMYIGHSGANSRASRSEFLAPGKQVASGC